MLLVWQTLPKWFWLSTKAVYKILLELYIVLNNLLKEINAFHSFKVKYITEDETNLLNEINRIYSLIFTFIVVLRNNFSKKNSLNPMQQRMCFFCIPRVIFRAGIRFVRWEIIWIIWILAFKLPKHDYMAKKIMCSYGGVKNTPRAP